MKMLSSVIGYARVYLSMGFGIIRVQRNGKKPLTMNWQKAFHTSPQDAFKFKDLNIGIVLGSSSNHTVDVDLDCEEARRLAPAFLPYTVWVFGHSPSAPASHYMYRCKKAETTKYSEGDMILEIRAGGAQTVMPGSVHYSGEKICFESYNWRTSPPSGVSFDDLERACSRLAAAVLVLRHGWLEGRRDEVAVSLCGLMLRSGMSVTEVDHFLEAIALAAGDEELDMRLKAEYQSGRLDDDHHVPGYPTLARLMGDRIAQCVIQWLGIKSLGNVHELLSKIAYVRTGNRARILVEPSSSGNIQFMPIADARTEYAYLPKIKVGGRMVPQFDYWLQCSDRRTYRAVVFNPNDDAREDEYNLWRGWPLEPDDDHTKCKRFLRHLREVICAGDADLYDYVLTWMANIVQEPTHKPGIALVLQSDEEGTGKTIFATYFLDLFGRYGITSTNQDHLFGKHNGHLQNKLLVFVDESSWAGNRHHASILKNMITSDTLLFEPKGLEAYEQSSHMRLIIATNAPWAVPAGMTARRFCVLRVSSKRVSDHRYFDALERERIGGGPAALMSFLMGWHGKRSLRDVPATEALIENKLLTMQHEMPVAAWWYYRLEEGCITRGIHSWPEVVKRDELLKDYLVYHGHGGTSNRSESTSFWMAMKRILPAFKSTQRRIQGVAFKCIRVPALGDCREFFAIRVMREPALIWVNG